VTTFVRTPADTVMLAHTNGYLTINRATPTAETVGMFSPAETRDATGKLVPSSYVVKRVAPQLYLLAEVFDPRPDTAWPVYVDPPLHLGGPVPAGLFDSITSTISSAASAVGTAVSTAASATVSGAQTVGRIVKAHPLESAMLVGGVAMALTGVGGPAGAAMIASAGVNIASAGVDFAAALNPDNQALGVVSNVLGVASMVTPQGAAKAAVKEVAEKATEELATHADDVANAAKKVIDTATEAPTPPTQLANDITAAPTAAKPPLPGVDTPKAPNAPPAKTSDLPVATSPETAGPCGCNAITPEPKGGVYVIYNAKGEPKYVGQSIHVDERLNQHISDSLKPSTKPGTARYDPAAGDRAYVLHRTDDPDALNGLEQHEIDRHNTYTTKTNPNENYNGVGLNRKKVYRDTNRNAGVYDAARDAHLQQYQRPSSPADQRQIQQASTRQSTDQQRQDAQSSAREANQQSSRSSSSESNNGSSHKSSDNKRNKKPKRSKSRQNHPKPKG
ncbi:GIY-YIG nuclease family protein, partial [Mycolicibacterium canariasense]